MPKGMEYIHRRREVQQLADVKGITLDGQPARIVGLLEQFAGVWAIGERLDCVSYSWEAVERIVNGDGHFFSKGDGP